MRKYNFTIHQIDTHNNIPKSQCLSRCLVFCFIRIIANPSVFLSLLFRITRRFMLRRKTNSTLAYCVISSGFQYTSSSVKYITKYPNSFYYSKHLPCDIKSVQDNKMSNCMLFAKSAVNTQLICYLACSNYNRHTINQKFLGLW